MNITISDLEEKLQLCIPEIVKKSTNWELLNYRNLSKKEYLNFLEEVMCFLITDKTTKSAGNHRNEDWNSGWQENYDLFLKSLDMNLLIPKYHGKYSIFRWNSDIIYSPKIGFDFELHKVIIDTILVNYLQKIKTVYEFGCGTGYQLIRLHNYLPNLQLVGADWAESTIKIVNKINEIYPNIPIKGERFNFFNPDYNLKINEESAIITIAALEQLGDAFVPFIDYVIKQKPKICIHFEPVEELLDPQKISDLLSIMYFRKRHYLRGFLTYLKKIEQDKKIEIITARKTYAGSKYIEGHSLIIWRIL